jgi:dTDP-4-dehydrorhamnose reductase
VAIPYGIYNYTGAAYGDDGRELPQGISWYDFACAIYKLGKELELIKHDCKVLPITSNMYSSKVKRPAYSVLDKAKIKASLGISIPDWGDSLEQYLKEINI